MQCNVKLLRSRYKRHNFGFSDWDRMAWAPELRARPKWYQMIAIRAPPRESSDRARLIYTRNASEPLLFCSQICHFMRLALQNWARRTFSFTFFRYKAEKGFNTEGRIFRSVRTSQNTFKIRPSSRKKWDHLNSLINHCGTLSTYQAIYFLKADDTLSTDPQGDDNIFVTGTTGC